MEVTINWIVIKLALIILFRWHSFASDVCSTELNCSASARRVWQSFREWNLEEFIVREAKSSFPSNWKIHIWRETNGKNPFDNVCLINVWFQLVKYWKSSMYDMNLVNRRVTQNRGRRRNKQKIVKVSFFAYNWLRF